MVVGSEQPVAWQMSDVLQSICHQPFGPHEPQVAHGPLVGDRCSRAQFRFLKSLQAFPEKTASGWNVGILPSTEATNIDIIIHQVPSTLLASCIIFLIYTSSDTFPSQKKHIQLDWHPGAYQLVNCLSVPPFFTSNSPLISWESEDCEDRQAHCTFGNHSVGLLLVLF